MTPSAQDRLRHILQAIDYIEQFLGEGFDIDNAMQASAIFFQMVVIGEAAKHVPALLRDQFLDIPWMKMLGLRNVLAHEYYKLEEKRIRAAIAHLPALKKRLLEVIG